jgi:hypothetical protein
MRAVLILERPTTIASSARDWYEQGPCPAESRENRRGAGGVLQKLRRLRLDAVANSAIIWSRDRRRAARVLASAEEPILRNGHCGDLNHLIKIRAALSQRTLHRRAAMR